MITRDFLVGADDRVPHRVSIAPPELDGDAHFCRVTLTPWFRDEKKIHGADAAQAETLAREFVRLLFEGTAIYRTDGAATRIEELLAP